MDLVGGPRQSNRLAAERRGVEATGTKLLTDLRGNAGASGGHDQNRARLQPRVPRQSGEIHAERAMAPNEN
jgi:hypothetical protein